MTIAMQRLGKQTLNTRATVSRGVRAEKLSWRPSVLTGHTSDPCGAGSNTSTMTLRVVGGDEKRSLKSETVKCGREY
jgi:hypothetical protein